MHPIHIVHGCCHQGDPVLFGAHAGLQCTAIGLVVLVMSMVTPLAQWGGDELLISMFHGSDLYENIIQNRYGGTGIHLMVQDLPERYHLNDSVYDVEYYSDMLSGVLLSAGSKRDEFNNEISMNLHDALTRGSHVSRHMLLTVGGAFSGTTVAIILESNQEHSEERVFIVDSHARNSDGRPHSNGTAVIMTFNRFEAVVQYLGSVYGNVEFNLTPIVITETGANIVNHPEDQDISNNRSHASDQLSINEMDYNGSRQNSSRLNLNRCTPAPIPVSGHEVDIQCAFDRRTMYVGTDTDVRTGTTFYSNSSFTNADIEQNSSRETSTEHIPYKEHTGRATESDNSDNNIEQMEIGHMHNMVMSDYCAANDQRNCSLGSSDAGPDSVVALLMVVNALHMKDCTNAVNLNSAMMAGISLYEEIISTKFNNVHTILALGELPENIYWDGQFAFLNARILLH